MSANTKIEWADHTFNPWIGCTKAGPGCDHCYAQARKPGRWINLAGGHGFNGERVHYAEKVGKKAAGRLLDGRTWDGMPA